jgi:hypothetical protein
VISGGSRRAGWHSFCQHPAPCERDDLHTLAVVLAALLVRVILLRAQRLRRAAERRLAAAERAVLEAREWQGAP